MNATRFLAVVLAAAVTGGAAGCLKYTQPVVAEPALQTTAERNFQAIWLASQEVLRKYRFTIDRMDRRAGLITTEPLTGQQFFEPWRKDAVTREALADSSLKTLHRSVVVQIQPTRPGGEEYEPIVQVTVSKPSSPPMEIHSTGAAYGMFILPEEQDDEDIGATILDYTYQQLEQEEEPSVAGQPTYQDPELAKRITDEIMAEATWRMTMGR
ncbi:MAG: hypothetical protein MUP47_04015 [Phycisphaerae bacterium]|nr:hypothetical protein [Phycisphaerae bacterium]